MTKSQTTHVNGSVGCAEVTQTFDMASPFSFEYEDGDVNGTKVVGAGVTGDVNPAFLGIVGQSKAVAGSWVAAPTVAVVVQDIYVAQAVLAAAAGPELTTQTILQTPEPTLPSGFTEGPPDTGLPSIEFTGHVESTAPSLDAPTPVHNPTKPGNTKHTKPGNTTPTEPGNTSPSKTDNTRPTKPIVASPARSSGDNGRATPTGDETTQRNGPGPGPGPKPTSSKGPVDNVASAILSAVTPTNALQVLQQAEHSLTHDSATASAILQGLGNGGNDQNSIESGSDGKPTIVIDGSTITANSRTEFVVGTATLTPGGSVVVQGTTVSLASGLTAFVVDGVTHTASPATITPAPVLTLGETTYAPTNGPTYVIAGQTLTPGGVITAQGTTLSLGQDGSSIVVNGLTQNLGSASASASATPPVLTIGGETFTAVNNGYTYVVNGETLTPGDMETVTLDGKTYVVSLGPGATVLMIETVGRNGDVTATTYETLSAGAGPQPTVTSTIGVNGATSSSGPSAPSVSPALAGGASYLKFHISAICLSLATAVLAIWL